MAKPNVHTANHDELVEAGVRAELADEILKLRRKGKIDLEALDEVPGVGPATLELLRKSLDFRDQPKNEVDRSERGGKDATDKATEVGQAHCRSGGGNHGARNRSGCRSRQAHGRAGR